ncbi:predicted protein [Sclerotinia sclerotiorum 1980 UF-70]|uniref:Rhodopsin domain-containing protein n=1 Tax=Sclerotinia sclerotiorum (strain ATCC 18683 / 1980 / Ss-1) TaxID=665079 RepID=A7F8B8_SCLS1|nr:predicted protein [Sclerotinia sclerotiorum 1980 UF-70]EDN98989.1 predicted protein [Sclerotinia sclerotiorum 1980 UF-70]
MGPCSPMPILSAPAVNDNRVVVGADMPLYKKFAARNLNVKGPHSESISQLFNADYHDDAFNGFALAALVGFIVTYQIYLPIQYNYQLYALGIGGYLPSDGQLLYVQNVSIVNVAFFWVTIYLVKASFLSLYWALFSVSNSFRKWWFVVAAYTLISFLATFLAIFWSCKTPTQLENLAMTLPLGMLRAMKMSRSRKLGLAAIAALVVIDIVFDILRTIYTVGSYESTFPNANAVWALCEPTIAVMVCALPTYRTLLFRKTPEPSTSYQGMRGTRSTRKNNIRNTSTPHEMDDISAYSLASTQSVLGNHAEAHVV